MAYTLNFPPNLTEEEINLKEMFEKMRRLKKALQLASQQSKEQAEKKATTKRSIEEVEGATEEAKRLVKSGAMKIAKRQEKSTFKRSKVLDRRLKDGESGPSKFQPYSAQSLLDDLSEIPQSSPSPFQSPPAVRVGGNSLYSNFVSSTGRFNPQEDGELAEETGGDRSYGGIGGNTIYIRGYDLVEDPLRKAFADFGNIQRINIEDRRRSAFIQYELNEQADKAIKEMNGNMVNGITLRVSMARRQGSRIGQMPRPEDSPNTHAWSQLAAGLGPKRDPNDDNRRNVISYDDADELI